MCGDGWAEIRKANMLPQSQARPPLRTSKIPLMAMIRLRVTSIHGALSRPMALSTAAPATPPSSKSHCLKSSVSKKFGLSSFSSSESYMSRPPAKANSSSRPRSAFPP